MSVAKASPAVSEDVLTVTTRQVPVPRAQHRLWLADQISPDSAAYLGSTFLRLKGRLDVDALRRALTKIVTRHEVLRTSMSVQDGEVVGTLRPPTEFRIDIEPIDPGDLEMVIRAEATAPLDVVAGLPLRARLLRLAPDDHVLSLTVHHLAFDGGSVHVLYRELTALYHLFSPGTPLLPEPPWDRPFRQFRDIAGEDEARYDAGESASIVAQRRTVLADRAPFELPSDHPRPATRSGAGSLCHRFDLPSETVDRLAALGRRQAATLYMVLLAGCQTLLYRYSGRGDVTTGASSYTRHDSGSEMVIGPFFNMVVVPGDVSGNPTFAELVHRVRDAALDAFESRLVAFDSLVTELQVERDTARTPLFQILVDFTIPVDLPELHGLQLTDIPTPGAGSKYDLAIEFRREGRGVGFSVEWDTALYDTETVMRLMAHLRALLVAVADNPSLRVDDVPMLSPAEVRELRTLAEPKPIEPYTRCLPELFADQAARSPDAVAVQDDSVLLTYAELDQVSTSIARGLADLGVGPDVPVGVLLDHSAGMVAALLGILKAGGAYLPLEPQTPPARIRSLLAVAGVPVCIMPGDAGQTETDLAGARNAAADSGCIATDVDALIRAAGSAAHAAPPSLPTVRGDQLCAVYFTSGSTGVPKAVACSHRGWVTQVWNMQERYRLSPGEAILLKTPLGFDDVAREIFWPLLAGGRVVVLPSGLQRDPKAILAATTRHRVVWLQFVPGMLALFLDEISRDHLGELRDLRHVVSDGDRLRPATVAAFFDKLGHAGCQLNNHWGTTEVSIDSTHHICTRADGESDAGAVSLGRPMTNNLVYVLDHAFQQVPYGAVGELCIGGAGLARGYLNDPGRTARSFVPHPWRAGERLYRTGDAGRLEPDGSLTYRGRRDHQVKVRGVRIELGEVEAAVRAFPGVTDCVVTTWEPIPGDHRLVAYVTLVDGGGGTDGGDQAASARARLREFLVGQLSQYAVPNVITLLPALPRAPSGKIDFRSLPAPDPDAGSGEPFVEPATDTEHAVAGVWAAVLGVSRLGLNDDFFGSGGHSLLVIRAVNRMSDAFGVEVPVRLVFEHPTVCSAAAHIEEMILTAIETMSDVEAERLAGTELQ